MKKLIAILAVISLGVLIAGCGKKEESAGPSIDKSINAAGNAADQAKSDAAKAAEDL